MVLVVLVWVYFLFVLCTSPASVSLGVLVLGQLGSKGPPPSFLFF